MHLGARLAVLFVAIGLLLTGCGEDALEPPPADETADLRQSDDSSVTAHVALSQMETAGVVEVVEVVLSEGDLADLWERHRLDGEPPNVEWDVEWAIFAAPGRLTACDEPVLSQVATDDAHVSVHLEVVEGQTAGECTDAGQAFSMIIAIDRDHMPADDFTVEIFVEGSPQAETSFSA